MEELIAEVKGMLSGDDAKASDDGQAGDHARHHEKPPIEEKFLIDDAKSLTSSLFAIAAIALATL